MQIKTVDVSTTEGYTEFDKGYNYCWCKNTGSNIAYISDEPHMKDRVGAIKTEGVASVPAGQSAMITITNGTLYHCSDDGDTTMEVKVQNFASCPFGKSGGSSGSGGGGSAKINYSLTEQDTGVKWVDGKPIYQRTFEPEYDSGTHDYIVCYLNTVGVKYLIKTEGIHGYSTRYSLEGVSGTTDGGEIKVAEQSLSQDHTLRASADFAYVTIWYTKTSDYEG